MMGLGLDNIGRMLDVDLDEKRKLAGVVVDDKGVRDYGGAVDAEGHIATRRDVIKAFSVVIEDTVKYSHDKCDYINIVMNSIYEYKAIANCFSDDTSNFNNELNLFLDSYGRPSWGDFPRL